MKRLDFAHKIGGCWACHKLHEFAGVRSYYVGFVEQPDTDCLGPRDIVAWECPVTNQILRGMYGDFFDVPHIECTLPDTIEEGEKRKIK